MKRSRLDTTRDRIAVALSNFILSTVATKWYRQHLNGLILLGLDAAVNAKEPS